MSPCRRSLAKSSVAIGRVLSGRSGRGASGIACTCASAAPAARIRETDSARGPVVPPATKVSSAAGTPAALPSRSLASNRGADNSWLWATSNAAAPVMIISASIRGVRERSTSCSLRPRMTTLSRHGPWSPCSARTDTIVASLPTESAAQLSSRSVGSAPPAVLPFPHSATLVHHRVGGNA
jgi:hypothetical protein